jgi:enoyl-CoA hydratase
MSNTASFAFPEINHGIPPTLAMSSVRRTVSAKALAYLIYSGEAIEATHAMAIGLASQVWGHDLFTAASRDFLTTLASRPRLILETIKRYQTKSEGLSREMASEYAGTLMALVRSEK